MATSSRVLGVPAPAPRWLVIVSGFASVVIGILLIAWPKKTVLVSAVLIGIYLILFGLIRFLFGLLDSSLERRGLIALVGILGVLAGLFAVRQPARAVGILVVLLGLYWIFVGFVEIFGSVAGGASHRFWRVVLGLVFIAAGVVVLLWPAPTALVLAIAAGIALVISGIVEILSGVRSDDVAVAT